MKARRDYKEPGYNRDTVQGVWLQEGGGPDDEMPQVTSITDGDGRHGYAVWLPRRALQRGGLQEGHITGSRDTGRRRDGLTLKAANIAKDGRHMEATHPGGRWTGLMKRSRARGVDPSPGVHAFSPTSYGRTGGLCHHS